ncbi:MAG TPA: hypothetical protein VLF15_06595 [Pseudoxanthomonas sp.]|nr:hypothetical protein [Pseudoxanthomonas sp.]
MRFTATGRWLRRTTEPCASAVNDNRGTAHRVNDRPSKPAI